MLIVQQNNNTIMCRFCKSLSVFFLVQKLASAGSTWCHPPVRRSFLVIYGVLPQQGALKKENNPSQAPLWARPPEYKLCGAPEDAIHGSPPAEAGRRIQAIQRNGKFTPKAKKDRPGGRSFG